MIDLSYKPYTNKDYVADEVYELLSPLNKIDKKQLRKLNKDSLLSLLNQLDRS